MHKTYFKEFDETIYEEKLDNGLDITIIHKADFSNSAVCFGTPYGSLNINQKVKDQLYNFNPGIAHFIEHKLFESKGDDIMNAFSMMGANVNAFTSYQETIYFFSKSNGEIDDCLNLLLDFVQCLDISEESIEKEKGIIIEELAMYKQNPDSVLVNETFKSLYKHYPLNIDIGGDETSVKKITKKELEECYAINYHPSKMKLVIVSPIDPLHLIEVIKTNQVNKIFPKALNIENANKLEPIEVNQKYKEIKLPINKDKIALAYKLEPKNLDNAQAKLISFALKIYYNAYFSKTNDNYQNWLDQKLINDYFDLDLELTNEFGYLLFFNESADINGFTALIKNELSKDLFSNESLALQKRRIIGSLFKSFDESEGLAILLMRYMLANIDLFKLIKDIQALTIEDIKEYVKQFPLQNEALIHLKPRS